MRKTRKINVKLKKDKRKKFSLSLILFLLLLHTSIPSSLPLFNPCPHTPLSPHRGAEGVCGDALAAECVECPPHALAGVLLYPDAQGRAPQSEPRQNLMGRDGHTLAVCKGVEETLQGRGEGTVG